LILNPEENKPRFNINFFEGPFVEIKDAEGKEFTVDFIDNDKGTTHYTTNLKNNHWARCSIKYYKNWLIRIKDKSTGDIYEERIDLKGKNILISIESLVFNCLESSMRQLIATNDITKHSRPMPPRMHVKPYNGRCHTFNF
jgi:hypothetical protein